MITEFCVVESIFTPFPCCLHNNINTDLDCKEELNKQELRLPVCWHCSFVIIMGRFTIEKHTVIFCLNNIQENERLLPDTNEVTLYTPIWKTGRIMWTPAGLACGQTVRCFCSLSQTAFIGSSQNKNDNHLNYPRHSWIMALELTKFLPN